ncbi:MULTISPECIES: DUF2905 domain-containing protein [Methylobacter]|jgi:Protein of unknown function (DUF2905)|uniref:DUF2905 domain-containing protein n=1 Tax=Methylobacter TaxID=429 RepID=UPI00035DA309|nr:MULTISPECIES: DUF2905 domain-containing protein [Methylobacter]
MTTGKVLMIIGAILIVAGLVFNYAPWLINWFGKLPGDIHIRDEKKVVFIPITSMVLISLVLTLIINLVFRR